MKHLFGLAAPQRILWEEEHTDAVVPLTAQADALLLRYPGEKAVGDLQQDAHAVAGLPGGVLARPVLQLLHDLQGVVHRGVGFPALDVHHAADAAGVVLKPGVIQPPLSADVRSDCFHICTPFHKRKRLKGVRQAGVQVEMNRPFPCPPLL